MPTTTLITLLALSGGLGLILSVLLTLLAMRLARRSGFVDLPGGHKSHSEPIPYGGGVAIFLSAWMPVALLLAALPLVPDAWIVRALGSHVRDLLGGVHDRLPQALNILLGALAVFTLGLLDDLRPLGPWTKLAVLAGVALLVSTFGEVRVATLAGTYLSTTLSVAWLLLIINAFNFLDNMDGLSAGVACLCGTFLVICGVMAGQVLVPALICLFVGAMLGFLVFNFPPARIFMGDAGSLLCGYMLAVGSVLTTYWESGSQHPPFALAIPLCVLAIPLYDVASVLLIRVREGRSPLRGDQRHFSHRLVQRGLTRRAAVLTIYLASATTGLAATLLPRADLRVTLTVVAIVLMVLLIVAILESPLRNRA